MLKPRPLGTIALLSAALVGCGEKETPVVAAPTQSGLPEATKAPARPSTTRPAIPQSSGRENR